MNGELQDKTAIVTGGAGGIGTHISRVFARAGAKVVLASRNQERLDALAAEITGEGGEAFALATDITVRDSVEALMAATVERYGRIDVLVNNAGGGSRMRAPEDTPYEEWVRLLDFNLTGTFLCCIAAGKRMIEQQSGNIVNIASTAGTKGNPFMLHYSAAKAGVISLTNNLAFSWAKHNIYVNCVAPGLIATDAMKRYGAIPAATREDGTTVPRLELPPTPEDVAHLVRFLASDAAAGVTGELIPVRTWFKSDRFWQ